MHSPEKPQSINSQKIILVEGKDDQCFLIKLLQFLKIEDFQIINFEGKAKFNTEEGFEAFLNMPGYEKVKCISVVCDADEDVHATFQSIVNVIKKYGISVPYKPGEFIEKNGMKVGVFIMPDCEHAGMLEDLCLESVQEKPEMECVKKYLDCVDSKVSPENKPKNRSKAKVQVFLAGQKEIANCIEIGARKNYWNLNHNCMEKIKNFLENLR